MQNLHDSQLGKKTGGSAQYSPQLLFPLARAEKRKLLGLNNAHLPFQGVDIWHAYEVSWLNAKGKPQIALAEFIIPCDSPNLIESKSFKLYLNSFNLAKFNSTEIVTTTIKDDLSAALGKPVEVKLILPSEFKQLQLQELPGKNIDHYDVSIDAYQPDTRLLSVTDKIVSETLTSNLLKSNCPITDQPDWACVQIHYHGKKIKEAELLKYIISFRQYNEFHEQCVERIFSDILRHCAPEKLSVFACYTRRGGLDINPFRANFAATPPDVRTAYQ